MRETKPSSTLAERSEEYRSQFENAETLLMSLRWSGDGEGVGIPRAYDA
jgi:hypothetical protein